MGDTPMNRSVQTVLHDIFPELLSTAEAARLCGMGERTLWRHSRSGLAPKPVKIGGLVRYRRQELLEWIENGCQKADATKGR